MAMLLQLLVDGHPFSRLLTLPSMPCAGSLPRRLQRGLVTGLRRCTDGHRQSAN
jgi:hypothetical protein